jgi:Fe-S-cluster containining protein
MSSVEHEQPWYAPGLKFSCTQCGNCCTGPPGYVWFEDEEADAIAAHLGIDRAAFDERYVTTVERRPSLAETKVGSAYDCVFLERHADGKKTCSIYEVRPTQCRTWPFWDSNLRSPRHWARAANTCPGMTAGGVGEDAQGTFVPVSQVRIQLAKNPSGL